MKRAFLLLIIPLLLGCSSPDNFHSVTPGADFSKAKSFTWKSPESMPVLTERFVKSAIEKDLISKGISPEEISPAITATAMLTTRTRSKMDFDFGFNYDEPKDKPGLVRGGRRYYEDAVLMIAFYMPGDDEPVWQGGAPCELPEDLTMEEKKGRIEIAVRNILSKFPPH